MSQTETAVERVASCRLPTRFGVYTLCGYREIPDGGEHLVLLMGDVADGTDVLVRVHSECMTSEVLGSMRCDCKAQLDDAMRCIAVAGRGVVVYLRGHEGRGIGLLNKLRAYALQDQGADTVEANVQLGLPIDGRDYSVAAQILGDLGIDGVRLMTNNPAKYSALADCGLRLVERVPLLTAVSGENEAYLKVKQLTMGHSLGLAA